VRLGTAAASDSCAYGEPQSQLWRPQDPRGGRPPRLYQGSAWVKSPPQLIATLIGKARVCVCVCVCAGVPQKLHAFELFLRDHPELRDDVSRPMCRACPRAWQLSHATAPRHAQVVLIQVAVPTREDVEEYQHLRASVNEMVGAINGQYGPSIVSPMGQASKARAGAGRDRRRAKQRVVMSEFLAADARRRAGVRGGAGTADAMPIHFLNKSVNFEELCALYAIADVCLVTSTRDGMNLVSLLPRARCDRGPLSLR
jgi:hypothetical protein